MKRAAGALAAPARKLARTDASAAASHAPTAAASSSVVHSSSSSLPPRPQGATYIDLCADGPVLPPAPAAATAPPERLALVERGDQLVPALARALSPFQPCICAQAHTMPAQFTNWSCGYANLGAMVRNVARAGRHDLQDDVVARGATCRRADVVTLQALVERAWNEGFDPEAAARYRGRLVGKRNRAGWIGAAETAAALWHLRIDALLVEVVVGHGDTERRSGGAICEAAAACLGRRGGVPVPAVTQLPMVLQDEGHSRTILGVTEASGAAHALVVRDPSDSDLGVVRCVPPARLDGRSYQLVVVRGTRRLGDAEASSRMGEPGAAARWRDGRWTATAWAPSALQALALS